MPCLETSFLVDYLNEEPYALEYLEANPTAPYIVPTLTYYELYAGAIRSDASDESISTVIDALAWADVIEFTEPAAQETAQIRADLLERGERINAMDMLIAGVAREANMILVATDEHFNRVPGLDVINPREDAHL